MDKFIVKDSNFVVNNNEVDEEGSEGEEYDPQYEDLKLSDIMARSRTPHTQHSHFEPSTIVTTEDYVIMAWWESCGRVFDIDVCSTFQELFSSFSQCFRFTGNVLRFMRKSIRWILMMLF